MCAHVRTECRMNKRHSRLTVLLTKEEMCALDEYCEKTALKKSSLAALLIREHLIKNQALKEAVVST